MAKPAKSAPAEAEAPAKPKSKKLLLAIVGVVILGAVGGAGWWFFMRDSKHVDEPKAAVVAEPTFMVLEPFTVNLQHEESDQFLQIGITLKVASIGMADKLRQSLPEVRSRLLFLLSSKRPSELMPMEGKKKLAREIVMEANSILGLRTAPQKNVAPNAETASGVSVATASGVEAATASAVEATPIAAAPVEKTPAASDDASNKGVLDALFTAFVIQ